MVVDSGRFDWAGSGKFPEFTEPLPGYHGMVLARDCGPMALVIKMRMETLRESGESELGPFDERRADRDAVSHFRCRMLPLASIGLRDS